MMDKEELESYLNTRRMDWPYGESYRVEHLEGHRFVARIGDQLAGLSYAEMDHDGSEAVMKMNLKSEFGSTDGKKLRKTMTSIDNKNMKRALELTTDIVERIGVPKEKQFLGTLNAGHPGGMLPLTADEKDSLHSPLLPENLYVADATILPKAMGFPPILTIMALAKRIAGNLLSE